MRASRAKGLIERKMENPGYRARFERNYPAFILEVQILRAMEKKGWTYARMAKAMHTSTSNISRDLSAGGIRTANIPRLSRMAEVLGMEFVPLMVEQKREMEVLAKIQKLVFA